ncbi:MAG: hypothetical protein H7124_10555 [Phycisphaerales bacterium]|nr:hypothetical protein [Hyphomonadaceae bacterium]
MGYELFYVIGAVLLALAIGYGVWRDKRRDKTKDALTEAATKEQYEHPERYQRTQKIYEEAAKD